MGANFTPSGMTEKRAAHEMLVPESSCHSRGATHECPKPMDPAASTPAKLWKVMIVDDEPTARSRLQRLLRNHPSLQVVATAGSVEEAARRYVIHQPELLFLDIELKDGTAFDLLKFLRPVPKIIFVTGHENFAVKAFEVNAVDYLLKPIFGSRLDLALERILEKSPEPPSTTVFSIDDLLLLRTVHSSLAIAARDIVCITAERNFSHVHAAEDRKIMIYRTLSQWEQRLPPQHFPRIDRSLLLNLSRLARIESADANHAWLHVRGLSTPLKVGRTAVRRLHELIARP